MLFSNILIKCAFVFKKDYNCSYIRGEKGYFPVLKNGNLHKSRFIIITKKKTFKKGKNCKHFKSFSK